METKDALLRIVKAARIAYAVADNIRKLGVCNTENEADRIYGYLTDALFILNGEQLNGKDFNESRTYSWLYNSTMTDDEVTNEFIRMAKENAPKQPKPNIITRDQFNELLTRAGGYGLQTPEGDWK